MAIVNRELDVAWTEADLQVGRQWSATKMTAMVRKATMVAIVMAAAIGVSGCSYNRFVGQEEAVKTQWSEVENQLQRRNDLIPNLVETVKGYAQQERDVFGQIADARAKLSGAQSAAPGVPTEQKIQAANEQSAALNRLLVVVENYPQLRSNESFNRLMDELSGTENRIAVARMRYNEKVQEYNTSRRSFPANVTASIFGFKEYPLFNAPPEAERAPRVDFGRNPS
jgi:LemA protein